MKDCEADALLAHGCTMSVLTLAAIDRIRRAAHAGDLVAKRDLKALDRGCTVLRTEMSPTNA
jgi:hypothetical protein